MSASITLSDRIDDFIAERQRLGFGIRKHSGILRSFDRYLHDIGHGGSLTIEVMAGWARCDSHGSEDPRTWARRLKGLRTFMRWLQQFDPLTEVPDDAIFGSLPGRMAPHIYSQAEIEDLLKAAGNLSSTSSLRGIVYQTLLGLIACTGLRISEALSLRNQDVDLKTGILVVHQSKFGKSRQLPLHSSTLSTLQHYCRVRDSVLGITDASAPLFVTTRGKRYGMQLLSRTVNRQFSKLRDQLCWGNRGTHHAPRIHDLRHTFIVNCILRWQREGIDVDREMLSLSTYVGHTMVTNTYWYLSAVPELMRFASEKYELNAVAVEVPDE